MQNTRNILFFNILGLVLFFGMLFVNISSKTGRIKIKTKLKLKTGGFIMLVKWQNPRSIFNLKNDVDSFFDDFFNTAALDERKQEISPRINVEENENEWVISAELPGVTKEDVKVNFQDGVLTISGEKKFEKEDKDKNYHRVERSYGKFSRSMRISTPIVSDKINAEYKDGILTISLPKAEEAKPKLIDVKVK
jgi:HSP20 family protein